jgi:hypothetical protein
MKNPHVCLMTAVFFLLVSGAGFAQKAPQSMPWGVAGFELGKDIAAYADRANMKTSMPIRYLESLHEVETLPVGGIKNGLIWYCSCAQPGAIVQIKLKYADSSKNFFDQLLERCTERFGKPDEWVGDSFQVVLAWKWSFTDAAGNRISLILQHNTQDEEEKIGNTVKMTLWNIIEKEEACFEKKKLAGLPGIPSPEKGQGRKPEKIDWDKLVPR